MKARRAYFAVWVSLGLSLLNPSLAPQAHGQVPPAPSDAHSNVDAKVTFHYGEGVKAAKLNQWAKAREAFLSAWQLKQHYQIAANLGRAELKLGMYRDAAVHLAYFLREAKDVADEDRQQAQALFDEARAKVAVITVQVDLSGAEILVDGISVGHAPLAEPVFVDPGRRMVYARSDEPHSASSPVEAVAGGSHQVALKLAKDAPPPKPEPKSTQDMRPADFGMPRKAILIGGIAVSATAAGVGIGSAVFAGVRNNRSRTILKEEGGNSERICAEDALCRAHYNLARADYFVAANLSFWTFIGAAAVGGGTAIYALTTSEPKPEAGPTVTFFVDNQGGKLTVTTTW